MGWNLHMATAGPAAYPTERRTTDNVGSGSFFFFASEEEVTGRSELGAQCDLRERQVPSLSAKPRHHKLFLSHPLSPCSFLTHASSICYIRPMPLNSTPAPTVSSVTKANGAAGKHVVPSGNPGTILGVPRGRTPDSARITKT